MYGRAELSPAARASLLAQTRARRGAETGGILVGRLDGDTLLVTRASPSGPRALHARFRFRRDTRFLQQWLDAHVARTDGLEDYIGEWHVHPALDAPPSRTDRRSLWRVARRSNYPTDEPLLLIVEDAPGIQRLRGWCFALRPHRTMSEVAVTSVAAR